MKTQTPKNTSYDVVIIGGAMMGASAAWFLSDDKDFDGMVLVVDRDLTYENTSTMHTNSCMRQQFSGELNVRISQFAADFIKNLPRYMGNDDRVPDLSIRSFGYMYLADNEGFADVLRESQKVQLAVGAATQLMIPDQIKTAYPFYNIDDIVLGSINLSPRTRRRIYRKRSRCVEQKRKWHPRRKRYVKIRRGHRLWPSPERIRASCSHYCAHGRHRCAG